MFSHSLHVLFLLRWKATDFQHHDVVVEKKFRYTSLNTSVDLKHSVQNNYLEICLKSVVPSGTSAARCHLYPSPRRSHSLNLLKVVQCCISGAHCFPSFYSFSPLCAIWPLSPASVSSKGFPSSPSSKAAHLLLSHISICHIAMQKVSPTLFDPVLFSDARISV